MPSLLRTLAGKLTSNAASTNLAGSNDRGDGFSTAKDAAALFKTTTPEIDGEECLHDCESCTIHLPRKFSIDEDDKLYGHINAWSRHLIVATGKTDWVRDVADEKDSVMEAVGQHGSKVEGGKLMLSASNIPVPQDSAAGDGPYGKDRPTTALLLPMFKWLDGLTPNNVPDLIRGVVNVASTNTTPLAGADKTDVASDGDGATSPESAMTATHGALPSGLSMRDCPHRYLILLCSQATRDARCGQSAPLIRRELERQLRPLGLYRDLSDERPGGVGIYFISHVGGHKYSANMLIYRRAERARSVSEQMADGTGEGESGGRAGPACEAGQCIWLARVRPEDCENIVRFTLLQGKIVKPERQLRGGFDREKGLVSW